MNKTAHSGNGILQHPHVRKVQAWLRAHPIARYALLLILAIAVTLPIALMATETPDAPEAQAQPAYFLDLNTGELFIADETQIAPIAAPSGPLQQGLDAGVRAHVFACGSCDERELQFVAWLTMLPPDTKQAIGPQQIHTVADRQALDAMLRPSALVASYLHVNPQHDTSHAIQTTGAAYDQNLRWMQDPTGSIRLALAQEAALKCGIEPLLPCTPAR